MGNETKATFHVVFDAEIGSVWQGKDQRWREGVKRVRPKRMTQAAPDLKGGEVCLKFEVNIPESAFLRLVPTVQVEVSDGFWTSQPMTVIVPEPDEEPAGE